MRCLKCGQRACFEIRRHRAAFCQEHLIEHLRSQVEKAIKKFKMFSPKDRILAAVSGGKDSLALWDILLGLGYCTEGLYIHLGITSYSDKSHEMAEKFAFSRGVPLYTVSLKEIFGEGMEYIARKTSKSFCSACGLIKRYVMNITAKLGGFDAVATGHNLDDEAAALLGNVLHWQTGYLARQAPNMPERGGLARKVKPLCRLTERETAAYCVVKGIDYILDECPMSQGASSLRYKETLNLLESSSYGTKDQFYLGFLERGQRYFKQGEEEVELRDCIKCGQPTTAEMCSFCRQMERVGFDSLALKKALKELLSAD